MVMEETPSPQCVGREFVRQYYTLLNQAPMHLHRFYNENSSFVHGGLDTPNREPVIGQRQIHHRIQQLEFNDCHAKIRQVDSQATLGNGVVVQVTGELSNNGEPMRRFTQTFVLAQQSPKKYYVHNDIFRYQDEMIAEEECEPDSGRSEAEEDMDDSSQPEATDAESAQQVQTPVQAQSVTPASVMATINGSALSEEVSSPSVAQPASSVVAATPVATVTAVAPTTTVSVSTSVTDTEEGQDADDEAEDINKQTEPIMTQTQPESQEPASVSLEPKTYATLVKSGGMPTFANIIGGSSSASPRPPSPTMATHDTASALVPNSGVVTSPSQQSLPPRSGPQRPSPHTSTSGGGASGIRSGTGPRSGQLREERRDINARGDAGSDDRRRMSGGPASTSSNMYPDNQQVFVGNVPIAATEEDLREIFSKFGVVVDVRLNSKSTNKCPPGKVIPKYGFIVFSEVSSVQQCLNAKPISLPGDPPHTLNVEEKRNKYGRTEGRMTMNEERGMGSGRPSMGRGGSSSGMMRGRSEGGSMSRGRGGMRGSSEGARGIIRGGGGGGGNTYNARR